MQSKTWFQVDDVTEGVTITLIHLLVTGVRWNITMQTQFSVEVCWCVWLLSVLGGSQQVNLTIAN